MPLNAKRLGDVVAAYSAVALARMARAPEGLAILQNAESTLGKTDILSSALSHIQTGGAFNAAVSITSEDDPTPRIKAALWDLSQMDHLRQAEVLQVPPEPFESFVIGCVRSATASITSLVPMITEAGVNLKEDDVSAIIRELLTARFEFLGWSVPDQSQGGFSGQGNPGERDLLIKKGSTVLAVIEAVVCKRPVPKSDLTKHFKKLFGYSDCKLFFHLTYSYVTTQASVLEYLKQTAQSDAPPGFRYLKSEDIPHTDSRSAGFVARYAVESDEVKVVFLLLDMSQNLQINAAKAAGRKASKGKPDSQPTKSR